MKKISDNAIQGFCNRGEKVIDSERFIATRYMVKDNNIVIMAGKNGTLSVSFENVQELCDELIEIADTWKDIHTGKCVVDIGSDVKMTGRIKPPKKEKGKKAV